MTRQRLPARRRSFTFDLEHNGARHVVCVGLYDGDRAGEVFVGGGKTGSHVDGLLSDAAVLISIALQHGVGIGDMASAMAREGDGKTPSSVIGAALDAAAKVWRAT